MTTIVQKNFQYVTSDDKICTKLLPIAFHRRSGYVLYYERNSMNLHLYAMDQNTRQWSFKFTWVSSLFSSVICVCPIEFLDCFAILGDSQRGSYIVFLNFVTQEVEATFPFNREGGLTCCDFNQHTREFLVSTVSGNIICLFLKIDKGSKLHMSRKKLFRIKTPDLHVPKQIVIFDLTNQYLILSDKQVLFCVDALTFEVVYSISAEIFILRPTRVIVNKCGTDFLVLCRSPDGTKEQLEYWVPPNDYVSNMSGFFSRTIIPLSAKFTEAYFETAGLSERMKTLFVITVDKRMQLWSVGDGSSISLESDLFVNIPETIWTQCLHRASIDRKDRFFVHGNSKKVINPCILPLRNFDKFGGPRRRCLLTLLALGSCSVFDIDFVRFSDRLVTESFLELERRVAGQVRARSPPPMVSHDYFTTGQILERNVDNDFTARAEIEASKDDDDISIMSESLAVALESLADLKKNSESNKAGSHDASSNNFYSGLNSELSSRIGTPIDKGMNPDWAIGPLEPTIKEESTLIIDDQSSSSRLKEMKEPKAFHQNLLDAAQSLSVRENVAEIDHRVEPKSFFPAALISEMPVSNSLDLISHIQPHGILMNPDETLTAFSPSGIRPFRSVLDNPSRDLINVKLLSFCYRRGLVVVVTEFRDCFIYDYLHPTFVPLKVSFPLRRTALVNDLCSVDVGVVLPDQPASKAVRAKIGTDHSAEDWIAIFLADNEGYVHVGICNYKAQLSKTTSFFAHQASIKSVLTIGDTTRPLWKVKLTLEFQGGHPLLGIESVPSSSLVSISTSGEVKCWLPSAVGNRTATVDNVLVVSTIQWRLSGLFVMSLSCPRPIRTGRQIEESETVSRSIQSIALLPSNLSICVGFDSGDMEQWVLPGIVNSGATVSTTQQCTWSSAMHSTSVTSIRSFALSYVSELRTVVLPTDGDYDRVMSSLTSYIKVDRRARLTAGLTFKEMKALLLGSSVVSCSMDKSMIIWGMESVFDVYCSFARPFPCKRFYFSFPPLAGLCFSKDMHSPPPSVNHVEETGWEVSMIGNGRIVPVLMETRKKLFLPICPDDENDCRKVVVDENFAVTSFDDDMTFDRNSSMTRHRKKLIKSVPVSVKVQKPSAIVAASRIVEEELENDTSANNSFSLLTLKLLQEWAKVKDREASTVVVTEEQTQYNSKFGTSRHVPIQDISERPTSPSLSMEQLLLDQFLLTDSPSKGKARQHPSTIDLGTFNFPGQHFHETTDSNREMGEKVEQNGLFLVAHGKEDEAALRTLIIDKSHHPRHVVNKSSEVASSQEHLPSVFQQFADDFEKIDAPEGIPAGTMTDTTMIIDDSPAVTRAPTRADPFNVEQQNDHHPDRIVVAKDSSFSGLSISNNQLMKASATQHTTLKPGATKPKYVSKTSLDKLDTRELVKHVSKESKRVPVAALHGFKTGAENELRILPSKPTATPKIDFEPSKMLVPVDNVEVKQELSLVLSIPSVHENDGRQPSAELIVPPPKGDPVTMNRAVIPQKFILKKEKVQAPKVMLKVKSIQSSSLPSKVESKHEPCAIQEKKVNAPIHAPAVVPMDAPIDAPLDSPADTFPLNDEHVAMASPVDEEPDDVAEVPDPLLKVVRVASTKVMEVPRPQSPVAVVTPVVTAAAAPLVMAVAAPVMSISIDLPDQQDEINRRRALQVAAQLQKKGIEVNTTKASSEPEVRGYFDRNVKPIFVEREAAPRHHLISKRFDTVAAATNWRDYDAASDSIPLVPMDGFHSGMRSPSNASIGTTQSKRSDGNTSKISASQQVPPHIAFLDALDDEERLLVEGLDERLREKLLAQLKKAKTGDIRQWKKITNKIIMESRILQMLKMDMAVDIIEVRDRSFRVSVASAYGGSMYVVLIQPTRNSKKPGKDRFKTEKEIMAIPGYVKHTKVSVVKAGSQLVQFDNLHPSYPYWVYVAVDRTQAEKMADSEAVDMKEITDTSPPVLLEMETTEENLHLEWQRLTLDMRLTELRAAIRSELIQIKTRFHFPVLTLPTDNILLHENTVAFLDPAKTAEERSDANDKLEGTVREFLDWWIGDEENGSRIREEFAQYEALQSIVKGESTRKFLNEGFIENDNVDVLTRYALFTLKESFDKFTCHRKLEPDVPHPLLQGKFTDYQRQDGLTLFKRFRSWYKGGVVVEDFEEQNKHNINQLVSGRKDDLKLEDSVCLSEESDNSVDGRAASVPLSFLRLMERESALLDLIEAHDKCSDMIKSLGRSYQYVLEKKFTEIMMIQDRGRLSDKDCAAIMGGKKLLMLCVDHMLVDEMELNFMENRPFPEIDILQFDPFMFIDLLAVNTPVSTKVVPEGYILPEFICFERVGAFDVFHAIDLAKLTPDTPPPANVKTLPGTNRHPVKAWQSMPKLDQEIELSLACSLDYIWDLAIEAGIEVPDPEDRSLVFDHFPDRKRIWKAFRAWYAGEEDVNPLPGQGIPTLARVLFSERYELKQIEDDPIVVDSMKKNGLPLPIKYREGELDIDMLAATFGSTKRNSQVKQRGSVVLPDGSHSTQGSGGKSGRRARPQRQQSALRKSVFLDENIETMTQAYQQAMSTIAGKAVRQEMIGMTLNKVLGSKRMQTLKWLWPPGLNRVGLQYLMPRAGFSFPKFSMPQKRFHLFSHRDGEVFNMDEISRWYTENDLDEDDHAMRKAEAKGVKLRAYHEWLAHEPERMEQSRRDMTEEDSVGWQRREIEKVLNARLAQIQSRLVEMDEDLDDDHSALRSRLNKDFIEEQSRLFEQMAAEEDDKKKSKKKSKKKKQAEKAIEVAEEPTDEYTGAESDHQQDAQTEEEEMVEDPDDMDGANDPDAPIPPHRKLDASFLAKKFFRFGLPLPKEYWYIFEESAEFKYGSGIHNDDEAEEIAYQQRMSAQKALEDAYNLEKYLNEEKKRREEEEKNRLKREEQDRRLKEGVLRRRQIRENLEEIKRQRVIKAAEEKARKEEQELASRLEKRRREEEEREKIRLETLEENRQRELQQMHQEEVYTRDYKIRLRELRQMEHEDIVSFLQEQIAVREEEKRQARIRELEELYTPFVPFQFKESRIRLPQLHAILREEPDSEEVFLQDVLDSMTLQGSRSMATTATTTTNRKCSKHHHGHYGTHEYFASNKLQEHDTESSVRHRSKRYLSLFGDVKYHPEVLHENPDAVALDDARRAEELKHWLLGTEEWDEDDDDDDFNEYHIDDNDSGSVDSDARLRAASSPAHTSTRKNYVLAQDDVDNDDEGEEARKGAELLEDDSDRFHASSSNTLRLDVPRTTNTTTTNADDDHHDDQGSLGEKSLSSASSSHGSSSRRRRHRPPPSASTTMLKQILSPRVGNNLVQRSVDSFPTREKIERMSREAKKRASSSRSSPSRSRSSEDPAHLLSVNPYEGHWMLLQRPTPVLYSSAPVLVQPTFHGTGVEALTDSPPRSRQRAARLLRPLKRQLTKDMAIMIHSATTSALPSGIAAAASSTSFARDPSLSNVHSSPYLPTALSPLLVGDKFARLGDAHELLKQYPLPSEASLAGHHHHIHTQGDDGNGGDRIVVVEPPHDLLIDAFSSSSSSLFHTATGDSHDGTARRTMKNLLALSSDVLARGDPKAWMKMLKTQRTLAIASLSTLEGGGAKHLQQERQKLIDIGARNNYRDHPSRARTTRTTKQPQQPQPQPQPQQPQPQRQPPPPLVGVEFDLMDFKTRKLAHVASATVERLQEQRDRVREYVNSDAMANDEYFLAAAQPGVHAADAIARSPLAEKFRRDLVAKLHDHEPRDDAGDGRAHDFPDMVVVDDDDNDAVPPSKSKNTAAAASGAALSSSKSGRKHHRSLMISSVSTMTSTPSEKSTGRAARDRPASPLKVIPTPGPKAVGALFGSTMKIAPKDKFAGYSGDSQEVVVIKDDKAHHHHHHHPSSSSSSSSSLSSPPPPKKNVTIRTNGKKSSPDRVSAASASDGGGPLVFHESSLASKPSLGASGASGVEQQPSLSLEEGDDELASSMFIMPLRSSTTPRHPSASTSTPPRTPMSPGQRSRSVKSVDLFIKTPRSTSRLAGEEIELEVRNTLQFFPSGNNN